MTPVRIAVFCNNRLAIPSLQMMASYGILAGIGIPENNKELQQDCLSIFSASGIPIKLLNRVDFTKDALQFFRQIEPNNCWLMTFPWKIPGKLLDLQHCKFLNFHYGLLPQMRGVDPIFEVIRRKEKETGITIHEVTPEIDKGPIVLIHKIQLDEAITHGMLCTRMAMAAPQICLQLIQQLSTNQPFLTQPQSEEDAVYYGRPDLQDVLIDWQSMDSKTISALVRACNPWNKGAYTKYKDWPFRILSVSDAGESSGNLTPGSILRSDSDEFKVHCSDNKLLKINMIYTEEGFFEGRNLFTFGVKAHESLTS